MQLTYDDTVDAAYVYFSHAPVARTEEAHPRTLVDFDADGNVRGVEFLDASTGVDLEGLPHRDALAHLLEGRNFPVFA